MLPLLRLVLVLARRGRCGGGRWCWCRRSAWRRHDGGRGWRRRVCGHRQRRRCGLIHGNRNRAFAGEPAHPVERIGKSVQGHRQIDFVGLAVADDGHAGHGAWRGNRVHGGRVDERFDIAAIAFAAGELDALQRNGARGHDHATRERDAGRNDDLHGVGVARGQVGQRETHDADFAVLVDRQLNDVAGRRTLDRRLGAAHRPIADRRVDRELLGGGIGRSRVAGALNRRGGLGERAEGEPPYNRKDQSERCETSCDHHFKPSRVRFKDRKIQETSCASPSPAEGLRSPRQIRSTRRGSSRVGCCRQRQPSPVRPCWC